MRHAFLGGFLALLLIGRVASAAEAVKHDASAVCAKHEAEIRRLVVVHGTRAVYLAMLFGAPENLPEYEKLITTAMQIQNAPAEEK